MLDSNSRIGSNQAILRVASNGSATLALGQDNKVGILDLTDLDATHPFYPQTFMGAGINDVTAQETAFQICYYSGGGVVIGEPANCGISGGRTGAAPGQFDYAIDTAPDGSGGLYVLEYNEHAVDHISITKNGINPDFGFGSGPGTSGGDLNFPFSIRRLPGGNLAISSPSNRRIDEFTSTGVYVRSYGFGVRNGANEFQTCGVGLGACQAGIAPETEPRSYFTQLDVVDGELYAATPFDNSATGSIQVIDVSGGSTPGNSVTLNASPLKVKKGDKTALTATLDGCEAGDGALFQRKSGPGWDDLGDVKAFDGDCKAKRKVKIIKKTAFRVQARDSGGGTIDTSPKVTVKLK